MKALVNTKALRRALTACAPHILRSVGKGDPLDLGVLRITLTPEQAWVQASNGVTAGVGMVPVSGVEDLTGDPYEDSFELTPETVATILAAFRVNPDNEMDAELHLSTTLEDGQPWIELQDVSGLIPGQLLQVALAPRPDHFPNMLAVLADRLEQRPIAAVDETTGPHGKIRLQGLVDRLKDYGAAQRAYGKQVLVQATQGHRALFVSCGPDFAGMLIPSIGEDDPADWHAGLNDDQAAVLAAIRPIGQAMTRSADKRDQTRARRSS